MNKTVTVNGVCRKVDYNVVTSVLESETLKPSKKYKDIYSVETILKKTISINGIEYETKRRVIMNGGAASEKWLGKGGVWVTSEKKMIESFLS